MCIIQFITQCILYKVVYADLRKYLCSALSENTKATIMPGACVRNIISFSSCVEHSASTHVLHCNSPGTKVHVLHSTRMEAYVAPTHKRKQHHMN